jgi:hypothetical protein
VTRKQVRIVRAVFSAVAVLVVLAIAGVVYVDRIEWSSGRAFDSAEWRAWGGDRWCDSESPRLEMVEDLRSKRLKVGMRKPDVMRLVGPPDYRSSRRSLEWGLGGTIDCEFLVLDFDQHGTLTLIDRYQG